MARHGSGTFRRTDRVALPPGTIVWLCPADRRRGYSATLLELGLSDMLLSGAEVPAPNSRVNVTIALRDRYIEFEVLGVVGWHHGPEFGVTFEYLSARQTYGLSLAMDLARRAAHAAPSFARAVKR